MYKPILIDNNAEKKLREVGYAVIPLLNKAQVNTLMEFYHESKPDSINGGFHSTHFFKDRAYKAKVHNYIKDFLISELSRYIGGYKIQFCNFMVKEVGQDSVMPLHTDWTFVDESLYRSIAIWCPLADTSEKNGALGVIPRSHQLPFNLRGPKIPTPFHEYNEEIISEKGLLLSMKAGEAVVYDHRLMHYSPPNLSDKTRVAINVIMTPTEAKLFHYCIHDDSSTLFRYVINSEEFFLEYDAFDFPEKALQVDHSRYSDLKFSREDLKDFLPQQREYIKCKGIKILFKKILGRKD